MAGISAEKPVLSQIAELVAAAADLFWPLLVLLVVWLLRYRLSELLSLAIKRIENATEIEWGSLKLKGTTISTQGEVIVGSNSDVEIVDATEADVKKRSDIYRRQENFMLVHTIRPATPEAYVDNERVFDVSIFLHSHKGRAHFNEIKAVTYFLGDYWGKGKYGSKFVIRNGNEQFALTAQMYGSFLCVAVVEFHDGHTVEIVRYVDSEMAPVYGISS
ncbi:pYEATS domain-containing protein [Rhizobium leguminosarum]|uniref:pYEATS domain-containing protein n=1 Tax=Rhizobium leguminosarum TaxID=384 RepID=UPI00144176EC|nr:pYEATS domain-containing protein [Rhizobium leguminosarum]NKL06148.1 hypothetical protein [Rhizobium leguminosarum bv. viciae]NKL83349.1 hypothetical protein [Rhizobium leguminosarum bv. viciae]NKL92282.1 hypothetical protein [Rhizobium leguminosarum bv. viciae]NKM92257.1 hypothetical protein [Rhizobium leguminosarum bv. viciae]